MAPNHVKAAVDTGGQHTSRAGPDAARHLREFIAALDARVPCLERAGELDIARDAARLRHEALERLAALESAASGHS